LYAIIYTALPRFHSYKHFDAVGISQRSLVDSFKMNLIYGEKSIAANTNALISIYLYGNEAELS